MQQSHPFRPELRHATVPTYVASYIFPLLLFVYEVYRVGYWLANFGADFTDYKQTGYDFGLMLALFVVQVVTELAFLGIAWLSRHADLEHRLTNLGLGLFASVAVLAFDYLLQIAF